MTAHVNDNAYMQMKSSSDCIEKSQSEPVIVFKHSSSCPTSTYAKREMDAFIKTSGVTVYLVIVQDQRPLSNELVETLKIKHESPQALCIQNGEVKSHFSHYDITQDNLKNALQ